MIAFTFPWVLLALVAAALPLLLHLVQRHDAPEVFFPAVRYLEDATRDQRKRLRFRHLLLLVLRTLLIVALVLAAAGATMRRTVIGQHAPSALVLVIDNSAASSAMVDGEPLLAGLVRAGTRVLDRATVRDRLWLVAADGIARAGSAADLRARVASLRAEPVRLDLGRAIGIGRQLIRGSNRSGEVVVVSPLQRSAIDAAGGAGPVLVLRPTAPVSANRGIAGLDPGLQPWGTGGGRVAITVASTDTVPVPVTLSVGGRMLRDVLVTPGVPSVQRIGPQAPGWITISASLPPDEFRLDDSRAIAVRVAPPAAVEWDTTDRYVATAAQVLAADGRIRAARGIRFGTLGAGSSVVLPPDDAARVGTVNRALAARGSSWRFGTLLTGAERTDSGAFIATRENVARRYALEQVGGGGDILATVNGAPWLVRSGDVVLLGSRLDPAWTGLPLSASFLPFLDAVLTGATQGAATGTAAVAGEPFRLPDRTTAMAHDGTIAPIDAGAPWTPAALGVFHLLAGPDTLGAISVRLDPRAADLTQAADRDVHTLWTGATIAGLSNGPALAFAAGSRADLRGALLVLALCCALAETMIVGSTTRSSAVR